MIFKTKSDNQLVEKGGNEIAYCSHCGKHLDTVFFKNDFVTVEVPGLRIHYGRIINIEKGQDGPSVIVDIGGGEREACHIDFITKVNHVSGG